MVKKKKDGAEARRLDKACCTILQPRGGREKRERGSVGKKSLLRACREQEREKDGFLMGGHKDLVVYSSTEKGRFARLRGNV